MSSTDTLPTAQTPANSLSSGAQNPPPTNRAEYTDPDDTSDSTALNDPTLPEQHHAGRVGYGPNFRTGPVRLHTHLHNLRTNMR